MEVIKVVVVEKDQEERVAITNMLSNVEYIKVIGDAENQEQTFDLLENSDPDVLIIGVDIDENGYKLAEKIAGEYPGICTIIAETEMGEETLRKAMFVGAKDVIVQPFTPSRLVDSIYRSYQTEKKKQGVQRDKNPTLRKQAKQGQVITVFSTKGGVGKTFVSTNLAVSLAEVTGEKVVLVDLDLDFGNAALALNIMPRYTISDIINDIRNLDRDLMESYLIPHKSGIKVLPANSTPQITEFITADHIQIILRILQSSFDYVVVAMPARFYEPVMPAFQAADILMLITTPDVATLRNIKASLLTLHDLNYPRKKIKILLNRAESRGEIRVKDVETTLNTSLAGIIPAEYKMVLSSLNKGDPVVSLYPRAKISRNFLELARKSMSNENGQLKVN